MVFSLFGKDNKRQVIHVGHNEHEKAVLALQSTLRQKEEIVTGQKDQLTKALVTLSRNAASDLVQKQLHQMMGGFDGVPTFNYDLERFVQEGYCENPHMFSVINKIVQPIKSIPWYTYRVRDRKSLLKYKMLEKRGYEYFQEAEHYKELALDMVDGTPMDYMFTEQANPGQTWSDIIELGTLHKLASGNRFAYAPILSGLKYICEMYILPSQVIEIIPGPSSNPVLGYQVAMMGRILDAWKPEHIIHTKEANLNIGFSSEKYNQLYGWSRMGTLGRVVRRSNQSYLRSLYLLINGGPPGIVSEDGNHIGNLDPVALEAAYMEKYQNPENTNIPLFGMGNLKYSPVGTDSAGLQIIETNNADLEDVCRVYDISALLMNTKTVTRDNMLTAERAAWLGPRKAELTQWREDYNRRVTRLYNNAVGIEHWCDYDLKGVEELQENKKEKSEMHLKEVEYGCISRNEYRKHMDYDEITDDPSMDERTQRSNSVSLNMQNQDPKQIEPPKPAKE